MAQRLKVDIRPGEALRVGNVTIRMVKKSGQLASLVIEADKDVPIQGPHPREVQAPVAVALP